jgi:hypothetical protein
VIARQPEERIRQGDYRACPKAATLDPIHVSIPRYPRQLIDFDSVDPASSTGEQAVHRHIEIRNAPPREVHNCGTQQFASRVLHMRRSNR